MNKMKNDDFTGKRHASECQNSEEQHTQVNLPSFSTNPSALRINELAAAGIAVGDGVSSGRDLSPLSLDA